MNIDMGEDGSVKISASAFVKATAETYLPKPLDEYPFFDTPSTSQLVKDYEIAARPQGALCGPDVSKELSIQSGSAYLRAT
eukprot:2199047-Pleurochrysis_carterae.AAC.1